MASQDGLLLPNTVDVKYGDIYKEVVPKSQVTLNVRYYN